MADSAPLVVDACPDKDSTTNVSIVKSNHNQCEEWIVVDDGDFKGTTLLADPNTGDVVNLSTKSCKDSERWNLDMPSMDQFSSLQILDLHKSRYLLTLHASVGQLQHLRELHLTRCDRLRALPPFRNSAVLQEIILTDSPMIESLPESIGEVTSLKRLVLGGMSGHHNNVMTKLPETLSLLANLEELVLDKCKALEALPEGIGDMKRLTKLSLAECKALQALPVSIGDCSMLTEMCLLKCRSLGSLPDSLGDLANLEDLNMEKCFKVLHVPDTLAMCESLASLNCRLCTSLATCPDLDKNVNLRVADFRQCSALKGTVICLPNAVVLVEGTGDVSIKIQGDESDYQGKP